MDPSQQDENAPDSWDSLEDPGPGESNDVSSDFASQLHSLNVNAKPFVPNVNAPVFVPLLMKLQTDESKPWKC